MLEKPDLPDENIVACVQAAYGLRVAQVTFLPLGADPHTAVYRVVANDDTAYFVKLRSGNFDELAVTLPKFFSNEGIQHIIAPLTTQTGHLWANLDTFKLMAYPFVDGRNGYEVALSERQWREFGATLQRIHTLVVPPALKRHIAQETYAPQWRESLKLCMARMTHAVYAEPVAVALAAFLKTKRDEVLALVGRAERLAQTLQAQASEFVLCHADIHAGNILIGADDELSIVDWDNPILAPKERDLMFIGGAQGFVGQTAQEEEAWFYRGYGQTSINPNALAYYRYERIIQDLALYCEQLLLTNDGGADRAQALRYVQSNFLPNSTLAMAYRADAQGEAERKAHMLHDWLIHLQYGAASWNLWRREHPAVAVVLDGANLNGMILTGVNFSRVSLRGAALHATNLMNADLRSADLTGANLSEADLIGAQLEGAILTNANLREADLLGADLTHAQYSAEDLKGALHVPRAQVS